MLWTNEVNVPIYPQLAGARQRRVIRREMGARYREGRATNWELWGSWRERVAKYLCFDRQLACLYPFPHVSQIMLPLSFAISLIALGFLFISTPPVDRSELGGDG